MCTPSAVLVYRVSGTFNASALRSIVVAVVSLVVDHFRGKAGGGATLVFGMDPPDRYSFRAAAADDLEAVAAVFAADDIDDVGEVVLDADFIGSAWNRSGFDLATDAWVVVDDAGTIVAYAHAMRDGSDVVDSWGLVHPAHRGQGLGPDLLDRIEGRAGQLLAGVPDAKFRQSVNAGDQRRGGDAPGARAAPRPSLLAHGHRPRGTDAAPVAAPDGIEIAGVDPRRDLPVMHAVLIEAFADDWGYHPDPFDEWAQDYAGSPNYDPTMWLLARDGTEAGRRVGGTGLRRSRLDQRDRGPEVPPWPRDRRRPAPSFVRDRSPSADSGA